MNKEEIKELAKETFIENVMSNLDSALIFTYIQNLEQENKQLKDNWNKLKEWIINRQKRYFAFDDKTLLTKNARTRKR